MHHGNFIIHVLQALDFAGYYAHPWQRAIRFHHHTCGTLQAKSIQKKHTSNSAHSPQLNCCKLRFEFLATRKPREQPNALNQLPTMADV